MRIGKCLVAAAVLLSPYAAEAAKYGTAGCGLGALLLGEKPGFMQVFAATTNGIAGNQTFGITSGTSNCTQSASVASLDQELFLRTNLANVMRDAAAGGGEYIATFATLLGCDESVQTEFSRVSQDRHIDLFDAQDPRDVLVNFKAVAGAEPSLRNACTRI